jgi:Icc protein
MKTLLVTVLFVAGCLEVAEERALREEEIGHATGEGIELRVEDGLGSVQGLARDGARIFASAPALIVHLTFAPGGPPFTLAVDNAMPGAVLTGTDAAVVPSAVATEGRWRLLPPAAGGELVLTIAPPDLAVTGPFRFAVLADVQEAIDRVQDIYALINADPQIRFVVFNGDLTQWGSTGELLRFQAEAKALRVPIFATLGNHELGSRPPAFHTLFGRGTFRYLFRGAQFTMLDSGTATIAPTTYTRLGRWLQDGAGRLHIVGMHIPPLDPVGSRNGGFASRAEGARLLAMLAGGRVDLTLYGHIHSYYSFWNAGIAAYISGGGGAIPERFDGIGRHFLSIDADPQAEAVKVSVVRVD